MLTSTLLDKPISLLDTLLRTLAPPKRRIPQRVSPAEGVKECPLSLSEKKHIAGLMRVNHAGEVCAQALYQGQGLTAHLDRIKEQMTQAAAEETDHLAWCELRLSELGTKPSILNPFWFMGSLVLGALAGLAGDRVSLGFVAETERQVGAHLQKHLESLPEQDKKTKAILEQMYQDEERHAQEAIEGGAMSLPYSVKCLMGMVSQLMTRSSYYL